MPKIKKVVSISTKNLIFRDAAVSDAEFLLKLRTDPQKGKFLTSTRDSLSAQRSWLEKYNRATDQSYLIILDKKLTPVGCIRLYNPIQDTFCWGSWILVRDLPPFRSLETVLVLYRYALDLGFKTAMFDVRQENKSVWSFHQKVFQPTLIKQDEIDRYYKLDYLAITKVLNKYDNLLSLYECILK